MSNFLNQSHSCHFEANSTLKYGMYGVTVITCTLLINVQLAIINTSSYMNTAIIHFAVHTDTMINGKKAYFCAQIWSNGEITHLPKEDVHYSKDAGQRQDSSKHCQEPLAGVGRRVKALSFEMCGKVR